MNKEEKAAKPEERKGIEDFRPDDHDWSFFKSIKGGQKVRRDEYRKGQEEEKA